MLTTPLLSHVDVSIFVAQQIQIYIIGASANHLVADLWQLRSMPGYRVRFSSQSSLDSYELVRGGGRVWRGKGRAGEGW